MSKPLELKPLVEGAMLAALTALLGLLSIYIPFLMLLANLWVFPVSVAIVRHNLRLGVMVLVTATVLVSMFTSPVIGGMLFLQFGGLGLAYGILLKKKAGSGKTVFIGTIVAALSMLLLVSLPLGEKISIDKMVQDMQLSLDQSLKNYQNIAPGLFKNQAQFEETQVLMKQYLPKFLKVLIPAFLIITGMVTAFFNYFITGAVLRRIGHYAPPLPPFREWRLPWYMIWGVIAGLGLILAGQEFHQQLALTVGYNILYVYFPLTVVPGVAVISYYINKYQLTPLLKGLIWFMILINLQFTLIIIIGIGLFDPVFDYRRLAVKGGS